MNLEEKNMRDCVKKSYRFPSENILCHSYLPQNLNKSIQELRVEEYLKANRVSFERMQSSTMSRRENNIIANVDLLSTESNEERKVERRELKELIMAMGSAEKLQESIKKSPSSEKPPKQVNKDSSFVDDSKSLKFENDVADVSVTSVLLKNEPVNLEDIHGVLDLAKPAPVGNKPINVSNSVSSQSECKEPVENKKLNSADVVIYESQLLSNESINQNFITKSEFDDFKKSNNDKLDSILQMMAQILQNNNKK